MSFLYEPGDFVIVTRYAYDLDTGDSTAVEYRGLAALVHDDQYGTPVVDVAIHDGNMLAVDEYSIGDVRPAQPEDLR